MEKTEPITKVLQNLLSEVTKFHTESKSKENERWERGESFNIFNTLGLKSEEVRLHSAFIGELLNPNGSHGASSLFLKAFLQVIPRESIILVALCHDLGKARLRGRKVGAGPHPSRSISILKRCGVELTNDEESAILNHHPKGFGQWLGGAIKSPLQVLLQMGDCRSTGLNKRGKIYRFSAI